MCRRIGEYTSLALFCLGSWWLYKQKLEEAGSSEHRVMSVQRGYRCRCVGARGNKLCLLAVLSGSRAEGTLNKVT